MNLGKSFFTEREGFEPSVVVPTTPVFKTGAFNHSATSPESFLLILFSYIIIHMLHVVSQSIGIIKLEKLSQN